MLVPRAAENGRGEGKRRREGSREGGKGRRTEVIDAGAIDAGGNTVKTY